MQKFIASSKETSACYALVMKGEESYEAKIIKVLRSILKEFKDITPKELLDRLLPIRDI